MLCYDVGRDYMRVSKRRLPRNNPPNIQYTKQWALREQVSEYGMELTDRRIGNELPNNEVDYTCLIQTRMPRNRAAKRYRGSP